MYSQLNSVIKIFVGLEFSYFFKWKRYLISTSNLFVEVTQSQFRPWMTQPSPWGKILFSIKVLMIVWVEFFEILPENRPSDIRMMMTDMTLFLWNCWKIYQRRINQKTPDVARTLYERLLVLFWGIFAWSIHANLILK